MGCAALVLVASEGIRLLAIPYLFTSRRTDAAPVVEWLGAVFLCSTAAGLLLKLEAVGELYVLLMVRLPAAVLTAGFLVEVIQKWRASERGSQELGVATRRTGHGLRAIVAALAVAVLGVQIAGRCYRGRTGLAEWLNTKPGLAAMSRDMQGLREALLWVRHHTETDAVLVTNTFTSDNMKKDHWGAVDGTLAGVHYYYSALSERRLLVEGPNYLLDPVQISQRLELAADIFYRRRVPTADLFGGMPCYAVIDHTVADKAAVALDPKARIFGNARIEIYRLPRNAAALGIIAANQ
jgi:hypothetical protein